MLKTVKGNFLIVSVVILTLGCVGLTKVSMAEGPNLFKEMKIKRMLRSKQARELQTISGAIGTIRAGEIVINNIGTRGEAATIQVSESDLLSWHEEALDGIEIRRYTKNSDTVLQENNFYLVFLAPISGSNEYFWLNDYLELEESELQSVMKLVKTEFGK